MEEMAWSLRGHEEKAAVVLLLELAVERFPESAALHERLGEAYLSSGNTLRASVALGKALDLIPVDPDLGEGGKSRTVKHVAGLLAQIGDGSAPCTHEAFHAPLSFFRRILAALKKDCEKV